MVTLLFCFFKSVAMRHSVFQCFDFSFFRATSVDKITNTATYGGGFRLRVLLGGLSGCMWSLTWQAKGSLSVPPLDCQSLQMSTIYLTIFIFKNPGLMKNALLKRLFNHILVGETEVFGGVVELCECQAAQ